MIQDVLTIRADRGFAIVLCVLFLFVWDDTLQGICRFFLYLKYIGKSESFREILRGTKAMFPKPVGDRVAIARLCFAKISTSKVGKQTTFKQYKQTKTGA